MLYDALVSLLSFLWYVLVRIFVVTKSVLIISWKLATFIWLFKKWFIWPLTVLFWAVLLWLRSQVLLVVASIWVPFSSSVFFVSVKLFYRSVTDLHLVAPSLAQYSWLFWKVGCFDFVLRFLISCLSHPFFLCTCLLSVVHSIVMPFVPHLWWNLGWYYSLLWIVSVWPSWLEFGVTQC